MEGNFTGKDVYDQHFAPKEYLKTYYSFSSGSSTEKDVLTFTLSKLHQVFITDGIKGDTLIDVGSGPTIYQFLSACESFREIIASDYTDQNREEMQRWLRKEPDAFDWSPVVKYVCELEGDREKWKEKEEKVRRAIRRTLKCDVTQANLFAPQMVPPATCVTTLYCLETACKDLATYRAAVKNIGSLVKPGGHLLLLSALQETFFMVGQHWFFCLYLEPEIVADAVREAGFDIVWSEMTKAHFTLSIADNHGGIYAVFAKKRSQA
ncbi:nicotinamide N-methyltransferase-like [Hemicordylus capensis]|uniref:nicotinamide N-methyltransferase-like n=1 Tax=Hemicordylus capensis TaxID=884348 RepID=UPI002302D465|nr:nicotinamide N-methyltransferase-like [Hemicordylus capensis]